MKKLSLLIVPLYVVLFGFKLKIDWNFLQWIVVLIVALDVRSGLITNYLYASRFSDKLTIQIVIPALHFHTLIVGLFYNHSMTWSVLWYILLNLSVWFLDRLPQHLQRSISLVMVIIAILTNVFLLKPPMLFEWLIPMLFINNVLRKPSKSQLIEQSNKIELEKRHSTVTDASHFLQEDQSHDRKMA